MQIKQCTVQHAIVESNSHKDNIILVRAKLFVEGEDKSVKNSQAAKLFVIICLKCTIQLEILQFVQGKRVVMKVIARIIVQESKRQE